MRKISNNTEAVSPVIATILMVAITVVIASGVYASISSLSSSKENTPLASLSLEGKNGNTITLEHDGGDYLQWNDLKILIDGTEINKQNYGADDFTVGENQIIENNGSPGNSYKITIIHKPSKAIILDRYVYLS